MGAERSLMSNTGYSTGLHIVRCQHLDTGGWRVIKYMTSGIDCLSPESSWKVQVEQDASGLVDEGSVHPFCCAVLLWCVKNHESMHVALFTAVGRL